ncbi:sensor histidine kinase [Consotaella aegiceratis]|uniref:sensor histidine kinase n=1 Tax=Consotaella aegiceratis TaxID=3097961 RepID=UPI002F3F2335
MKERHPSLIRIVTTRVLLFALVAMIMQTGIVVLQQWSEDTELASTLIEEESEEIGRAYLRSPETFPSREVVEHYGLDQPLKDGKGYRVRILLPDGSVAYSNCHSDCPFFMRHGNMPDEFWSRVLAPGKPLTVAGAQTIRSDPDAPFIVQFASLGDPDWLIGELILHEVIEDMVIPMSVMLLLLSVAMIFSIRNALRPVVKAVKAADALDPASSMNPLPTEGMPREVLHLTLAVNRALQRVAEVVRAQKIFSASIAHEIRTPVAVVKLELGNIAGPRARKAEADLEKLTHTLEQLTALARLDVIQPDAFTPLPLGDLVEDAVEHLAPYVFANGRSVELEKEANPTVRAVPALLLTLVRNLVENATKHTPPGTTITVSVAAPARVLVSDNGLGLATEEKSTEAGIGVVKTSGSLGVGLKIVRRIAALHGAELAIDSVAGRGTQVALRFPPDELEASQTS